MPASKTEVFLNRIKLCLHANKRPWNLDNVAAVSRGILWTGPRNLAKFTTENCGP